MSNKTASLLKADEPKTEMKPENPYVPLTFKQYSTKASTYRNGDEALNDLSSEVDALIDLFDNAPPDAKSSKSAKASAFRSAAKKKTGDILWTLVAVADDLDASLEECALINLVKLRDLAETQVGG